MTIIIQMSTIFYLIFCFFTNAFAQEIDMRPLGLNFLVMTQDSAESSDFNSGIELCKSLGMELPAAKELFQIWCHANLPVIIDKRTRKECQKVGISNTILNFNSTNEDETSIDYWSSTPDTLARNWARGVDFKKGVYFITHGNNLSRIRCIKRFESY